MRFSFSVLLTVFFASSLFAAGKKDLQVQDVTKSWQYKYAVVSAFPGVYEVIPTEENWDITRVFHFYQPDKQGDSQFEEFFKRRIEVFETGGDWMANGGFTYFITDAEQKYVDPKTGREEERFNDEPRAYFIQELSTTDYENGETAPQVSPSTSQKVREFIEKVFLTKDGLVNKKYVPVCGKRVDEPCVKSEALPHSGG